ncbi:ABC transporter substrate-binding protein [Paenibacillus eucommiae]|uniref:Multiple sugar transport system substrate-binding protein n=1 Tax=Paenibacillus eucommiae TaxID=1355755 RepID=A0ABS4J8D0_9BACL|nr:extracellular solute-binding protein [Paenibacillus eucommiae]MBP1996095.1 multiple sugar transport system substrate-binding protein [Paenibacillus eucommiae]
MKKWRKKPVVLIWTLIVAMVLTACTQTDGKKDSSGVGSLDREDKGSLKVAYFNEQAFYMQYGNAFQAMFPNVALEVVSTESVFNAEDPGAEMERLVKEQRPDVMYLTEDQYAVLAKEGLLYDLDAVVKQDEFDLSSFLPSVIDLLKAHGGGKLYGLSPDFSSQALYYNKDMFDEHGIPYPTDGMSWEEVMQLAARFPVKKNGDDALYGLFQSSQTTDPFELIRTIGEAKGLQYADADAKTVSIETPEWKSIFQSVIEGYKSGSISMPSESGGMGGGMMRGMGGKTISFGPDSMRFMSGQAAMTIDGPMMMNFMGIDMKMGATRAVPAIGSSNAESVKNPIKEINWDVVTVPVDPSQPDVVGSMSLDSVFSINESSENLPAAWEFLKYANGEQLAKTSVMSSPSLSARTAFKKEMEGKHLDAFYKLGANQQSLLQTLPEGFAASFAQLASGQIKKVVEEALSVDEALKTIQTQGQALLTKSILDGEQG